MKEQGILQAIFNLDNAINLNNAFSDTATYKNPILKSIDAKGNQITTNSGITYFNYNNTSLEHLPELIINTNVSSEPFTSTKLKYLNIKNNSNLNTRFPYMYNLEKIDSSNNIVSQNRSFFTNIHLKQLPKLSYNEMSTLDSFITNASNLYSTDIDLSNNKNLKILGIYGNSSYRINGLKSLKVSNEAPFDSTTSPQINVSYTGLDRTALVNLFNSMPYNVGYEIVGSPMIVDGIASNFLGRSSYVGVSQSLTYNSNSNVHVHIRFKTSTLSADTNTIIQCNDMGGISFLYTYSNIIFCVPASGNGGDIGYYNMQSNTWYVADVTISNNQTVCNLYDDNGTLLASKTRETTFSDVTNTFYFGLQYGYDVKDLPVVNSVDLTNTYIEVDGQPWFRGQPAMNKSIDITGTSGLQDLTVEDKAIVTDKGWSLITQ